LCLLSFAPGGTLSAGAVCPGSSLSLSLLLSLSLQEVNKWEHELYSTDTAKTQTCEQPSSHACTAKERAREVVEKAVNEQFGQQVRTPTHDTQI
jgi:hypothetical protein